VLEIGCAEADWVTPMLEQRPDLQITAIDWRACERPCTVIRGDVLRHDFPEASFDAVVGISSIEHIGLGHYEGDPLDVDGDVHCMERVARWLKPGGWVYADVPFDTTGYRVWKTKCRIYDDEAVRRRLLRPLVEHAGRYSVVQRYASREGALLNTVPMTVPAPFAYVATVAWT